MLAYTTQQRTRRNWLCLFFFLPANAINSHLLHDLAFHEALIISIDTKQPLDPPDSVFKVLEVRVEVRKGGG